MGNLATRMRRKIESLPLKIKAALFCALIFALGMGSLAYYVADALRRDSVVLIGQEQKTGADFLARTLEAELRLRLDVIDGLARHLVAQSLNSPRQIQTFLNEQTVASRIFSRDIYFIAANGIRTAEYPQRGHVGTPYNDSSYFISIRDARKPAIRVWFGRFAKKPVLLVAVPVIAADGTFLGALCGADVIAPGSPLHLTDEVHNGQSGGFHVYALDQGIFAASTDPTRVLEKLPAPGINPLLDRRLKGYTGPGQTVDSKGLEVVSAAAMVPTANWMVVSYLPTREAFAPQERATMRIYSGAALITLLVALLVWLGVRRSLAPLERAARQIGETGAGHIPLEPVEVQGSGEIRMLLQNFNLLQQHIAAQNETIRQERDHLEVLVEERTAELVGLAKSLRDANQEQQAVFDAARIGIILTRDRIIRRCNRTIEEILGYEPGEILEQSTRIWYPDEATFLAVGERVREGLARHGYFREELELVRKDGSRFWGRIMAQVIDRNAPEKGMAGTVEDIGEERRILAEMAQAKALAEAAAQAKADFLANMSHEIRTPMNAVIGMTHLALKTDLDERQREYLRKIQHSSQHLLGIINDILDFSKSEAGKLHIEQIDFDLEKVLEDVSSLMSERATSKGLEFVIEMADEVPRHLVGDPLRIGQVLINYASNAVKFTERGEVAIHVGLKEDQGQEVLLRFAVHDTGIGIKAGELPTLFNSFQQADSSTTRKYGGTGLGLVIAKRLAELMGGQAGAESEPGRGSTFWFTARLGRSSTARHRAQPRPDLRTRRLLVVDDHDHARDVVCDMLRSMSFQVRDTDSGNRCLAELQRASAAGEPYDIVFLDWQMPEMDGLATAREIRRLELPQPPLVLMITAYGRDELARSAGESGLQGIEEILIKPVSPSQLFNTVMRILDHEDGPLSAADPEALPDLAPLAGLRVLLVEDNQLNQEVASEFLAGANMVVDVADDGASALEKVRQQRYDVILMDMQMPVMDGIAATREIRKQFPAAVLPILAMTANAMEQDRERCLAAGMNDHIAKPVDPRDLLGKLLKWLAPGAPVVAPQAAAPPPGTVTPTPPVAAPAKADRQPFAGIPGLDATLGLHQALDREGLYLRLMDKFVSGQREAPQRLARAIDAGDWVGAEREAHTLKGVSAQIGAMPLRDLAERLEHAIRQRDPPDLLQDLLGKIADSLPPLVDAIAAVLATQEVPAAKATVNWMQVEEVCARLAQQLANDDFACEKLLDEHEALLHGALGEDFPPLARAVRDFDFTQAQARLQALAASHRLKL